MKDETIEVFWDTLYKRDFRGNNDEVLYNIPCRYKCTTELLKH